MTVRSAHPRGSPSEPLPAALNSSPFRAHARIAHRVRQTAPPRRAGQSIPSRAHAEDGSRGTLPRKRLWPTLRFRSLAQIGA